MGTGMVSEFFDKGHLGKCSWEGLARDSHRMEEAAKNGRLTRAISGYFPSHWSTSFLWLILLALAESLVQL